MSIEQGGPSEEETGIKPEDGISPEQPKGDEQPEGKPDQEQAEEWTKERGQQELFEKFGMRDTAAFKEALKADDADKAREWLRYIEENRDHFPQYDETWDNWLADRNQEISQQELFKEFGMKKTADFRDALEAGDVDTAKKWLQHITDHRGDFPQYKDNWFEDRQAEIAEAEK